MSELSLPDAGVLVVAAIGVGSLLACVVFVWRWLLLTRGRVVPARLVDQVQGLLARGERGEALALCRMHDSPLARLYVAALQQVGKARADIKERVQEIGRQEGVSLQAGLVVIETVAVVAPLLGLLGTVWGMIEVFRTIAQHGVGDAGRLAGGIGTALYTTLAGLLVAIPARIAHSALLARTEARTLELEAQALSVLDLLEGPKEAPISAKSSG